VIVAATVILAVVFLLPLIARLGDGNSDAGPPLAAFSPAAAVVAIAATVLAFWVVWWLVIVLAIPTVFLVAWQLPPPRLPRRAPSPRSASESAAPATVTVRVLTLNALHGRADTADLVSLLASLSPDVLAVQELTPELAASLTEAGVADVLPVSYLEPWNGPNGIGLWSRWPLTKLPPVPGTRRQMIRAELNIGWPLTVTVVHTAAPVGGRQPIWKQDMEQLRGALAETVGHQIVAGDFNATRDHKEFRRLLATGLADSADAALRRQWPAFTWPTNKWYPPVMRLDHILVTRAGATVRECRTVAVPGSDHLGVLAVIELRAPEAAGQDAT